MTSEKIEVEKVGRWEDGPSAVGGWRQTLRGWRFEVGGKKIGERLEVKSEKQKNNF